MDKVKVRLKGRQKDAESRIVKINQQFAGEVREKGGKLYVSYMDNEMDKDNPVSTMLKIAGDSLTIIRKGAVGGIQRFVMGQEDSSSYRTPYGTLELKLRTTRLNISMGTDRAEVDFAYDVIVNGEYTGHNKMVITID